MLIGRYSPGTLMLLCYKKLCGVNFHIKCRVNLLMFMMILEFLLYIFQLCCHFQTKNEVFVDKC